MALANRIPILVGRERRSSWGSILNTILANAVASITLGIEDYRSDGKHRALSALRNISAGLLLLFKEKLVQLDPKETLIKADFTLEWSDGKASWSAKGDKTIDYRGIKERFKLVGISFDFKEMDNIVTQRNRIEHYLADFSKAQLRSTLSNCVAVITRFCRDQLHMEPASLLTEEVWSELLKEKEIHRQQKIDSLARINQLVWPHELMRRLIADHYYCGKCGGDMCSPADTVQPIFKQRFACVACGYADDYREVMEDAFCDWAAGQNHVSIKDGGDAVNDYCMRCHEETVIADNGYCVLCGMEHYETCSGCGQSFHVSRYCEYCDAMEGTRPDDRPA